MIFTATQLDDAWLIDLEPREDEPHLAIATGEAIHGVLDRHGVTLSRLLHGEGRPAWPVLEAALAHGDDIRIGFEDTLLLPDGSHARSNADLVDEAVRIVRARGSEPAHVR